MLVIGCRLGEITTFGWTIPAAGHPLGARRHRARPVAGPRSRPPAMTITVGCAAVPPRGRGPPRDPGRPRCRRRGRTDRPRNAEDRAAWEAATVVDGHPWSGPGVHPGKVITILRQLLPDDAILTTDAGSFGSWAARGFRFRRPGTFLGSTSGAMGYGLPAAIAAGLVHRDRAVVALVGDGGLGMTLAEIETAVRIGLRTIVLVFDNQRYGMIRTYQDRRPGAAAVATDLGPIDFAAAARALGARGVRVEDDAAFEPALRQALVADRPTVSTSSWIGAGRASTAGRDARSAIRTPSSACLAPRRRARSAPRTRRARGGPSGPRRRARPRRHARAERGLGRSSRTQRVEPRTTRPTGVVGDRGQPRRSGERRPVPTTRPAVLDRRDGHAAGPSVGPGAGLRHLRRLVDRRDRPPGPRLPALAP